MKRTKKSSGKNKRANSREGTALPEHNHAHPNINMITLLN